MKSRKILSKMGECPLCGESTNKPNTRLIKESCGHSKCRLCLINEDNGCSVCEGNNGEISCTIESIGNFDYRLPAPTIPNYEELHSTPRKLDFNKIPDDFIDCPLDIGKLTIDNSINQNSENVVTNIPGPEKVDIGTETESIVAEKDVESQTIEENTHSSFSEVTQTPTQPVTKLPEVFANTISNNHQPHQETPVVQNTNFIPVTQRADGRQFITIAFIANNSPNKNQQVVAPLLNQCLPTLANVAAVQRPGGNQCIPILGNINALQNGNQFIIRNPNIVQNLVGNQSIPVIGNLNTMQNLPGNQTLSIVGNVNAVNNLVGNESLPPLAAINPLQSATKGQSFPTTGNPNVVHKVDGSQPCQVTQAVSNEVEEQSAPIQENAKTARKQVRTRCLPRIKNVKNVNIVQKSATNQSDKLNKKSEVQIVKGKKRRKELPVYLIPRKSGEQKSSPLKSPMKSPPQATDCMGPEFKLEDYLLFNRQQKPSDKNDSEIQTEIVNDTQMINKPSESVINETSAVSDQFNCTVIEDKFLENKVDESEQEGKVPIDKTNDEKSTKDISIETDECEEHQDLNVIFNIRDENKRTANEKINDEEGKIRIPNREANNKEEYQSLDVLFDIIEKESKKLNGGMFDKEEKLDLDEENDFDYEEKQKLYEKMDSGKDSDHMSNEEVNIEGRKDQNLNNGIYDEHNEDQHVNENMDNQNKEIENSNQEMSCNDDESTNSHDITYDQERNFTEELPIQNGAIELLDEQTGYKEENHHILNTEMKDQKEESEVLDNVPGSTLINEKVNNEKESQSLDEKTIRVKRKLFVANESENQVNESPQENDQHFDGEIMPGEEDNYNENGVNDDKDNDQYMNEKIDDEEKNNQTLYEDISDEEKDSEELNNENQEPQTSSEEINDEKVYSEYLNEKTVEEKSQIFNGETVNQDEERNQSLTIERYEEENTSAPLDTNRHLPAYETNGSNNNTLDVTRQKEELGIVKKPRGRPKKSLPNYERTCKPKISHKNEHSIAVEKDRENLNTEVNGNEGNESLVLEAHIDEKEISHENINTNLTLAEAKKSEVEKPDTTIENTPSIVIKQQRERKKKLFNDYELDSKPESLNKNQQLLVKKSRGRPKKSLSNTEQPNKLNNLQEIERLSPRKLPSICKRNNYKEGQEQHLEEKLDNSERQVLVTNVQIHNQKIDNSMTLDIHDKEESMDSYGKSNLSRVTKNPRGRPKSKNVLLNAKQQNKPEILHDNGKESLQSNVDAISYFLEKNESADHKLDHVNGNEHSTVIKNSRGRSKKSTSTTEKQSQSDLSGINVEPTIKKSRGRPRKSLTNFEQQNEDEKSQVLNREDFSQDEMMQDSRVNINDGEQEDLHSDVITNLTYSHERDSDARKSVIVNGNESSIVVKKPRGRPKKSLTNCEQQIEPEAEKSRGRLRKSLSIFEQQNDEENKEQRERDGNEENQILGKDNLSQDDALRVSSVDVNDEEKESSYSTNITNLTSSHKNDSDVKKSTTVNGNESSIVIKKPRGRPKKSLTNCEQQSQPAVSDVNVEPTVVEKSGGRLRKSLSIFEQQNDEENKEQRERDGNAENKILGKDNLSQDDALQNSSVDVNDEEKESSYSTDITNLNCSHKNDSDVKKSITVNGNESSIVVKKPRGRPKKSLTNCEQQSQPAVSDVNVEPTVVEKSGGRLRKSLSIFEPQNDEENKEQRERDGNAENQILGKDNLSQDDALQNSSVDVNDEEKESSYSTDITNLYCSHKNHSDVKKSITVNGNESSIVVKKPRGRPKKSLSSFQQQIEPEVTDVNIDSTVVEKSRGKLGKSLSIFDQQNDEENKEQRERDGNEKNQILDKDNLSQDDALRVSSVDVNDEEKESSYSTDITNLYCHHKNDSDVKKSTIVHGSESSIVIKKPRGRPKKSLTNCEQQSQPAVSDVNVEPTVVEKSRDRAKTSSSIFEQQNEFVSQETDLSSTTENSILFAKVNDEKDKEQHEVERNQDLSRQDLESNQNSSVIMNESLHPDVIISSITSVKNDSDNKAPNTVEEHEQPIVIKKLSSNEQQQDPVVSVANAQPVVVKKSRGRPKKSLSNLEQPNVLMNSELGRENNRETDQVQYFNGVIDKEERKLSDEEINSHDDKIQSLSTSLHTEDDESSILETEINMYSNQNSVNDKLEITHQSEQITIVKKARGRPKKQKHRGGPKKTNYEQQSESNVLGNKEHQTEIQLPSLCTDYSDDKDKEESRVLDSEDDNREELSQMETTADKNKSSLDECEKEKIDNEEQEDDIISNEDVSDKMKRVSIQGQESDEGHTKRQNCNEVSNNEESGKEVEEEDSQHLRTQDDENKENKKEYSEKDGAQIESIAPVTEDQDLEKSNKVDDEIPKNNTTGRKYKKFDKMNEQVIVGSSKRKRKPKVLLYENEDLDISPIRKKKKHLNKSPCKNEGKATDKMSPQKTHFDSSTHVNESAMNATQNVETEVAIEKINISENELTSVDEVELSQNASLPNIENSWDTEPSESNIRTIGRAPKGGVMKIMKRTRRPKTLLYENEDLKITPKSIKKKKDEFSPVGKDSMDSMDAEEDSKVTEGNKLEVFTNECELATSAKKSERVRQSKTLLYENERLKFMTVKEEYIKFRIKKEDLMIMKKFEIKLEPIVVLERNIDLSIIKKYDSDDNSLHITHERQETIHARKRKSTVNVKRPRGRPKLSNEPTKPKNGRKNSKVLSSKYKKLKLGKEKKRPGRPRKNHSHIITLPGEPPTFQCTICLRSFKQYANKTLHLACVKSTIKSYNCEFCSRKFYHKTHLEYHERLHKGEKPFRCHLCSKKFLQKGKLNRHLLIHKHTQDLECNECGKKFVSKEYLKSHLLSHVKSSFVFRCNQCPKSFTMDANRRRHELSHSPVALFKCPHCPKSFKTKYEVAKHSKIHQKMRPFACDQCSKTFLTKFEVKRHSVTHSGEKRYNCKHCQQQFGRVDNYGRHMLHHHSDQPHEDFLLESTNSSTPNASNVTPSHEEKTQEKKKDKLAAKPKKIVRALSNPVPMSINFIQPLTPQSAPSPYSISQNHELASVIHETLPDMNNAVPVINAPICAQPSLSLMDPIPLEQALVLNRQIEEKIYMQSSFCEFPGLTRRVNVTVANSRQNFTSARRNSSESNSNSDDGTSFLTINQEQTDEQQDDNESSSAKKDIHVHWRRRTAETFKSKIDQNK